MQIASKGGKILPIWHNISLNDVISRTPYLADIKAEKSETNIDLLVLRLFLKIYPDQRDSILRRLEYEDALKKAQTELVHRSVLKSSPARRDKLSDADLIRVKVVYEVFRDYMNCTLDDMINNFKRDLYPDREIKIWEAMAYTFLRSIRELGNLTAQEKEAIYEYVLTLSFGEYPSHLDDSEIFMKVKQVYLSAGDQ